MRGFSDVDLSWTGCPDCGPGNWPNITFSACNFGNPVTFQGYRFKTLGVGSYGCFGGAGSTVTGAGPFQYQINIGPFEQVLPLNACHATTSCGGATGAGDGNPYDPQLLIKEGSCNPPDPALTPTPMPCSAVDALIAQSAFYNPAVCVTDTLGKNGGIHSGGFLDTFLGQTQITFGLPATTWSINATTVSFDPASMSTHSSAAGNGPMYMMASVMGQEFFSLDMQFMMGIGAKEGFAALTNGSSLFLPANSLGVNGTYHVENTTFGTIVGAYPSLFPDYACVSTFPNVTTAMGSAACLPPGGGIPGINAMSDFYMTTAPNTTPFIGSDSAQLVNSVITGGFNFFRLYDAAMAATDICFRAMLENSGDDEAAAKFLPGPYNRGINSTGASGVWAAAMNNVPAAAGDVYPYVEVEGVNSYTTEVLRTAHELETASSCGGAAIYDAPITLANLETFFFGNGGTVSSQSDGGLMLHFDIGAAARTAMWSEVVCAFNKMDGLAPSTVAGQISFRYDFLTILRVARQYLGTVRTFPTQSDFSQWVSDNSTNPAGCGIVTDTAYPYIENVTPPANSQVCPNFTVNFDTWDETSIDTVEWTLNSNWTSWNNANNVAGNAYDFVVPDTDPNFPASGFFTVWIKTTDDCGNATIHPLRLEHSCGTPTYTWTPTYTNSPTMSFTPTFTETVTNTYTFTPTVSPSDTHTPTITLTTTPTFLDTFTHTPTVTPTATLTDTPVSTFTYTHTLTATPSFTLTFTASPIASDTVSPTITPTFSQTASGTSTYTMTVSSTITVTPTQSFTNSPIASATDSPTISPTATHTPQFSPTNTATWTATYTYTPTLTATASHTPSATPTATFTVSEPPSPTSSRTATASPSGAATGSATGTITRTWTPIATSTHSPTSSFTLTSTSTITLTATRTATPLVGTIQGHLFNDIDGDGLQGMEPGLANISVVIVDSLGGIHLVVTDAAGNFSLGPIPAGNANVDIDDTDLNLPNNAMLTTAASGGTDPQIVNIPPGGVGNMIDVGYKDGPTPTATEAVFYQQNKLIKVRGIYPNPFREELKIYFTLRVAATVTIVVFDVAGEVLWTRSESLPAGVNIVKWPGQNDSGKRCASGIYPFRLVANGVDGSWDNFWEKGVIAR